MSSVISKSADKELRVEERRAAPLVRFESLDKELRQREQRETLSRVSRKYLLMSGKGGVGKSTLCVNLAAALAADGFRVGVLDVDLHGPSVASALSLPQGFKSDADGKLIPFEGEHGLMAMSIQPLLASPDAAVIWRGPKKLRAIEQFFFEVHWGELDYLFIDAPPGTGDEPLAVLKAVADVRPIMVSSGSRLCIDDVTKAFNFLKLLGVPAAGVIDSQSFMFCPHCGDEIDLFDRHAAAKLAKRWGVPLLASVPFDPATVAAAESGRPAVWSFPESPFSRIINELAMTL